MASKVWGGKGTMSFASLIAGLGATGYTEVVITPETDLELNNEFGDTTRWDKLIRGGIRVRGTFSAWFETSTTAGQGFEPNDLTTNWADDTKVETADADFTINLDGNNTPASLAFSAFLSDLTVRKTSTAYCRIDGTFRSSGAVTGVNAA